MRYVATVYKNVITSKGINYTDYIDKNEIELTKEQYDTIPIPCKLIDGEFIECEIPVTESDEKTLEIAPTKIEQLRADIDYIALMTGVKL